MHVDAVLELPADLGRRITFVAQFANVFELRRILQLDVCRGWQIRRNADQFAVTEASFVRNVNDPTFFRGATVRADFPLLGGCRDQ
ncbi:hypothetical protein D3C78_1582570 [compost metagenome]